MAMAHDVQIANIPIMLSVLHNSILTCIKCHSTSEVSRLPMQALQSLILEMTVLCIICMVLYYIIDHIYYVVVYLPFPTYISTQL